MCSALCNHLLKGRLSGGLGDYFYRSHSNNTMMRVFILVLFSFLMVSVSAQKIKRESVTVEFTSRPSEPFPSEIKSYSVDVMQTYKLEFESEMEQWAIDTEIARVDFERESQAYGEKGTGAKLLERALLDEKKPTLVLPSKPVKREYIFEAGVVSSKIDMQGMNKNTGGAVVTIDIQSLRVNFSGRRQAGAERQGRQRFLQVFPHDEVPPAGSFCCDFAGWGCCAR